MRHAKRVYGMCWLSQRAGDSMALLLWGPSFIQACTFSLFPLLSVMHVKQTLKAVSPIGKERTNSRQGQAIWTQATESASGFCGELGRSLSWPVGQT